MRIHLILRSMWPKRAHSKDVHVGMVELMGLGDEVCPVIPRIEGLLRGVLGDARQLLSLQHPHARASSHPLWSGSDTEEKEGTSIKHLTTSTYATASCCSHASVWIHVVDSAATPFLPIRNQTNRTFWTHAHRRSCPRHRIQPQAAAEVAKRVSHCQPWLFF
jgi:hypothetical protein